MGKTKTAIKVPKTVKKATRKATACKPTETVKPQSYVVWDGKKEKDYQEDPLWHDCSLTIDMKFISVQKVRRWLIQEGLIPTVIFSCKRGQKAKEFAIKGKIVGVFSHHWFSLLIKNPSITFRDAVRLVNKTMKQKGIIQQSEIVCRSDILNMSN